VPEWEKDCGPGIRGSGDVGVVEKYGIVCTRLCAITDCFADIRETGRDISDDFSTDIDPFVHNINERIVLEVIVVVMAMDYPSIESFRSISRIMDQAELQAFVFYEDGRDQTRVWVVMVPGNQDSISIEQGAVLP